MESAFVWNMHSKWCGIPFICKKRIGVGVRVPQRKNLDPRMTCININNILLKRSRFHIKHCYSRNIFTFWIIFMTLTTYWWIWGQSPPFSPIFCPPFNFIFPTSFALSPYTPPPLILFHFLLSPFCLPSTISFPSILPCPSQH